MVGAGLQELHFLPIELRYVNAMFDVAEQSLSEISLLVIQFCFLLSKIVCCQCVLKHSTFVYGIYISLP